MFHTIVSIKNDGHYFCRAGGNRPDGLNEPVTEDTGETDFDTFRDAWWGEADSEEAFAVEFASDTGLLADVPETVALYFDYEAYARDLFLDSFTFIDGHVFRR
ncbi:hypothetical protein CKS89_17825 [Salmonella enterica subsp. enterica serovar Java]|nr:hypothetical protein [Salmonella enterica subsp. enterica serovar Java]